ncbi:MAG: ATPase, T2SS/T4P/T4SS family [Clostridia bacterium]
MNERELKKFYSLDILNQNVDEIMEKTLTDTEDDNSSRNLISSLFGQKKDNNAKEELRKLLSDMKDLATSGDEASKRYMIDHIRNILINQLGLNEEYASYVVDFDNVLRMSTRDKFELLCYKYELGYIIEMYEIDTYFTEERLNEIILTEYDNLNLEFSESEKISIIARRLYADIFGYSVVDCLEFMDLNEIEVLDPDSIWVVNKGKRTKLKFLRFNSITELQRIQKKLIDFSADSDLNRKNPGIITDRYNGSRVAVTTKPLTVRTGTINLRNFNLGDIYIPDLRQKFNSFDVFTEQILNVFARGRANIAVTGDMGTGKSTFVAAYNGLIPNKWGIGTIETQDELKLYKRYVDKDIVPLIENPSQDAMDCFEFMLKQYRDIIEVGEVANSLQALVCVLAMLKINPGSIFTLHLRSPMFLVRVMRNHLLGTDRYSNEKSAEEDVAQAIDINIHMGVNGPHKFINQICEVEYRDVESTIIESLKMYDTFDSKVEIFMEGILKTINQKMLLKPYTIRPIITFNGKEWEVNGLFSAAFKEKLLKFDVTQDEIDTIDAEMKERLVVPNG